MQNNNTGQSVSWKWLLYDKVKNVLIIYLGFLNFREINFSVDIFLWTKFLMTLRGHIPVNFQYFPSNSLHFMHLFKPFKSVMQFEFAWTYFLKICENLEKLISHLFSLAKVVLIFYIATSSCSGWRKLGQ